MFFCLEPALFTPDDLLTPTQKLKRNLAAEKYRGTIDALYDEIEKSYNQKSKL